MTNTTAVHTTPYAEVRYELVPFVNAPHKMQYRVYSNALGYWRPVRNSDDLASALAFANKLRPRTPTPKTDEESAAVDGQFSN